MIRRVADAAVCDRLVVAADAREIASVVERAGYEAVPNVRHEPLVPEQLLARAARALHRTQMEGTSIGTLPL